MAFRSFRSTLFSRRGIAITIPFFLNEIERSSPSFCERNKEINSTTVGEDTTTGSFPNFSRHGENSLIRQYLTEDVYNSLKDRVTSKGVRLEDLIRGAVSLPFGAQPPRGIAGVYAGDAESYEVFAPLLDPLIESHHHAGYRKRGQLRRHRSNLNPNQLLQKRLDPDGQYILYTRMRLARSIEGFQFAPCISRAERRKVEEIIKDCVSDWHDGNHKHYQSIMTMTNSRHQELLQNQLLFPSPDSFACTAGTHRDWPDARGVYCNNWDDPEILIWANFEDHLWIISNAKGGDVQGVFSRLSTSAWAIETSLAKRGYSFVEDGRLGFLNTSPTNIGPALRASVYVKLVRLGRLPGFQDLISRLRLEARPFYEEADQRYTGIFDIANKEALGKSEVELINVMIEGVGKLIDAEKRLENGQTVSLDNI